MLLVWLHLGGDYTTEPCEVSCRKSPRGMASPSCAMLSTRYWIQGDRAIEKKKCSVGSATRRKRVLPIADTQIPPPPIPNSNATPLSHLIDLFVAAVVPRARVSLAVLVGHDRAQRVVHGLRGEVLRRDQNQAVSLTNLRRCHASETRPAQV